MLHEEETIHFQGADWQKIKNWCAKQEATKIGLLLNPSCTHDEANRIRGGLTMLKQLLALENDAAKAAQRKVNV